MKQKNNQNKKTNRNIVKNVTQGLLHQNALYTVIAIFFGFLVGGIFLWSAGFSPLEAYAKLFNSVFSRPKYLIWSVIYATPLMFTGLSVAFSYKMGVFNIGAEGQYVVGSLAALCVGILLDAPPILHVLLCMLAAIAAGMVWSLLVAILRVRFGINEVLSFIMFNWIAFYLSNYVINTEVIHKVGGGEASKDIRQSARILLPQSVLNILKNDKANYGIFLAIIAAIAIWFILTKTTLGYRVQAVGLNPHAAKYGGINSNKTMYIAMSLSGALAALGGAIQLMGNSMRISQFAGQEGFGFQGITVALIASSHPIGCIFAGLFYGAMKYGGSKLNLIDAPTEVVDIIMGTIVLFIAISHVFRYIITRRQKKKEDN
ncbi:ABC transporter permease [Herbinix luporum]|uniref:ABC transporter permease n=1 Tax=Herbinix luporum TaxID=1679721 RepID=UPI00175E13EF|nr:ABC transporter permease [Herbinix luporum]HHT56325.1 ABC transporter permease [Herbinix luporum]